MSSYIPIIVYITGCFLTMTVVYYNKTYYEELDELNFDKMADSLLIGVTWFISVPIFIFTFSVHLLAKFMKKVFHEDRTD